MTEYETYEEWVETWPEQWEPIYGPGGGDFIKVSPCRKNPEGWDWNEQGPPPKKGSPTQDGWEAGRVPLLKKTDQAVQKLLSGDIPAALRLLRGMVGK